MLKKIALAVAVLVLVLLAVIAMRPDTFHVERSAQIAAPADVVFPLINDFHQWGRWSPWEKVDPSMQRTYGGPPSGPGATYAWAGNNEIGEGRMTILESKPGELVRIKLEFLKPFEATNQATFTLVPSAAGTRVTWAMDGDNAFIGKAISLFMDMDEMVGSTFAQGLAQLDTAAQADAQQRAQAAAAQ